MQAMGVLGERLRASYVEVERTAAERQTLNTQLNGLLRELDAGHLPAAVYASGAAERAKAA
mgnify:CR=1 FL=1